MTAAKWRCGPAILRLFIDTDARRAKVANLLRLKGRLTDSGSARVALSSGMPETGLMRIAGWHAKCKRAPGPRGP